MAGIKNNRGFTLIETVVSIAIFGILLIPLLSMFMFSMNNNLNARIRTGTTALAQGAMEWYKAKDFDVLKNQITDGHAIEMSRTKYAFSEDSSNLTEVLGDYRVDWYDGKGPENSFEDMQFKASSEGIEDFNFALKVVLTYYPGSSNAGETIEISVTAWDRKNGDNSKVNLVSLKGSSYDDETL